MERTYSREELEWQRQLGRAEGERTERKRVLTLVRELGIVLPDLFEYMLEYDEGSEDQKSFMEEFKVWMKSK